MKHPDVAWSLPEGYMYYVDTHFCLGFFLFSFFCFYFTPPDLAPTPHKVKFLTHAQPTIPPSKMSVLIPLSPPFQTITPINAILLLGWKAIETIFLQKIIVLNCNEGHVFPSFLGSVFLSLGGNVGIATERGLSERGHNYILQYARRWQGFYAS